MDRVNGYFRLFRWGELMNAVAEVEDMAMGILGILKQPADSCPQLVLGQEQGKGVEVALDRLFPDLFDRFADGNAPIEADDVGPRSHREFEEGRAVVGKINKGDIARFQGGENLLHIGQGEFGKIVRRRVCRPSCRTAAGPGRRPWPGPAGRGWCCR